MYEPLIPARSRPDKQTTILNDQDPDLKLVEVHQESSAEIASIRRTAIGEVDARRQLLDQIRNPDQEDTRPALPGEYFRLKGVTYRVQNLHDFREVNKEILKKIAKVKAKQLLVTATPNEEPAAENQQQPSGAAKQETELSEVDQEGPRDGEIAYRVSSALERLAEYERTKQDNE